MYECMYVCMYVCMYIYIYIYMSFKVDQIFTREATCKKIDPTVFSSIVSC